MHEDEKCSPRDTALNIKEEEQEEEERNNRDLALQQVLKEEEEKREEPSLQILIQNFKEEEQNNEGTMKLSATQPLPSVENERDKVLFKPFLSETKTEEDIKVDCKGGVESCQTLQRSPGEARADGASSKSLQIRKESDAEEERQQKMGQVPKEKSKDGTGSTYNTPIIKKEKDKGKRERDEKERTKEKKDRSKEKKDRGKDRDRDKERVKESGTFLQLKKREEEDQTREGSKNSQTTVSAQRDEKLDSKTQPSIKREKEHEKDRGSLEPPPRSDAEEARDSWTQKHKSSHGKKEKSGHREGKDNSTSSLPGKLGREDGKPHKHATHHVKKDKDSKKEKDVGGKEEKKKPVCGPPQAEHKPARTLFTFDLFKPMEAHQTLAFSLSDIRPKPPHHHSDSRGSSSKSGSDSRTMVPSKGLKVKDSLQGKPAAALQDSGPQQHPVKQPLKTHTPQTQKDFLL